MTELPLLSVVFGLAIWDCDQALSYLRFFEWHFLHSLYYFVLDFYKQIQLVLFLFISLFHFFPIFVALRMYSDPELLQSAAFSPVLILF